nr:hypothetical protein GCM10020093_111500 [Planobispora longispora]
MWIAGLLLLVVWAAAVWIGFVAFPFVFAALLLATTVAAACFHFYRAGRILLPGRAAGPSPVEPPRAGRGGDSGGDPAYRQYLLVQVWRDWRAVAGDTVPAIAGTASGVLSRATTAMMRGVRGSSCSPSGWRSAAASSPPPSRWPPSPRSSPPPTP